MNRKEQLGRCREYIEREGLDDLIDFSENIDLELKTFDWVSGKLETPFPPEPQDLVRLHRTVRERRCLTILEFGLGYSTIVMADALRKNQRDWEKIDPQPEVRNRFMFQLFSVDTSEDWIESTRKRFPETLLDHVHLGLSEVEISTFNGQICHYYRSLPDIVPDFIYIDGPSPKDVKGAINGLSFQCDERTVMSGDLLLMEPTFLPGTYILFDGRTNNARFLQRNFTREYDVIWEREGDVTSFELVEERLGKYNILGRDFF